jgi:hypothetical protein
MVTRRLQSIGLAAAGDAVVSTNSGAATADNAISGMILPLRIHSLPVAVMCFGHFDDRHPIRLQSAYYILTGLMDSSGSG